MSRGKYADRADARRADTLQAQVDALTTELASERSGRAEERREHKRIVEEARTEAATKIFDAVHSYFWQNASRFGLGIAAAEWKVRTTALTEHMAWLFFRGYLDWDRLRGDQEVLTFINTHGDIDTWWEMTHRYGWRKSRHDLRDLQKQRGILALVELNRDIDKALSGNEKLRKERKDLDAVVEAAREAFATVEIQEVFRAERIGVADVSEEERALHAEIMAAIEPYLSVAVRSPDLDNAERAFRTGTESHPLVAQ